MSTHETLRRGLRITDSTGTEITYRYIQPADNIDVITAMLHEAYASALLALVERLAQEKNVKVLALDTSEYASGLIALYEAKGYSFVEYIQWPDVNYRSMIFAKAL